VALQKASFALFQAHAWRWAGLHAPPPEWTLGADALFPCYERGLISRLRLQADAVYRFAPLRRLIAEEPVSELVFVVHRVRAPSATALRTLLPFPHSVRATVVHTRGEDGEQDALCAALLSAPVLASVTELMLNGIHRPGLVGWLAKGPFLGEVRTLELARNGLGCPGVCDLVQNPRLAGVERLALALNRIGNAGALALVRSPHLRNVVELNLSGNWFGAEARTALEARFGAGLIV
jgi:hypothetical protein